MKTQYIFESHDEILEFIDEIIKQSTVRITESSQHKKLYIDFPKGLLQSQFDGMQVWFNAVDPTKGEEEEEVIRMGGIQNVQSSDDSQD